MDTKHSPSGRQQLGWFAFIYVSSLVAFSVLVYGIRALVPH